MPKTLHRRRLKTWHRRRPKIRAPECSAESAELDVPREEIPGVGGATPTVLQTDVTVDIPLEATRAIYVFNARVANAREGYPTARCDLFVKSQGADIFLASRARAKVRSSTRKGRRRSRRDVC